MDIETACGRHLFSARYDGEELNEFDRLFLYWNDTEKVSTFMMANKHLLNDAIWKGLSDPNLAALRVSNESIVPREHLEALCANAAEGYVPDLDTYFKPLDIKHYNGMEYAPHKSYGLSRPSLLRLYAIRLKANKFIVVDGGIKLCHTIQESPDLKDHVLKRIREVRRWLIDNGIFDENDF